MWLRSFLTHLLTRLFPIEQSCQILFTRYFLNQENVPSVTLPHLLQENWPGLSAKALKGRVPGPGRRLRRWQQRPDAEGLWVWLRAPAGPSVRKPTSPSGCFPLALLATLRKAMEKQTDKKRIPG